MIDAFLNGGPFMMLLLILLGIIIFISVKNIKKPIIQIVLFYWEFLVLWLVFPQLILE